MTRFSAFFVAAVLFLQGEVAVAEVLARAGDWIAETQSQSEGAACRIARTYSNGDQVELISTSYSVGRFLVLLDGLSNEELGAPIEVMLHLEGGKRYRLTKTAQFELVDGRAQLDLFGGPSLTKPLVATDQIVIRVGGRTLRELSTDGFAGVLPAWRDCSREAH